MKMMSVLVLVVVGMPFRVMRVCRVVLAVAVLVVLERRVCRVMALIVVLLMVGLLMVGLLMAVLQGFLILLMILRLKIAD
jgi:hypothetical protein